MGGPPDEAVVAFQHVPDLEVALGVIQRLHTGRVDFVRREADGHATYAIVQAPSGPVILAAGIEGCDIH